MKKSFALLIFGPTAVGKTDFVLEIAQRIPAEIINGDSGQFYTPLSIGTAKPDWKSEPVPHHLFDIIHEPKHFSVVQYRSILIKKIDEVFRKGKLPIVVGGSGFYLKSIFFPPYEGIAKNKIDDAGRKDTKTLWEQLNKVDTKRAQQINKGDVYRILRALNIWEQTGKKPSECVPVFDPPINFSILCLNRERKELYDRINMRTGKMVYEGWLKEVEILKGTDWEPFLKEKKLIGYEILLDYFSDPTPERCEAAIKLIKKRTRHYAKRQETFWKSFRRQLNEAINAYNDENFYGNIQSINLTLLDRDLYIKQLLKMLRVHIKPL